MTSPIHHRSYSDPLLSTEESRPPNFLLVAMDNCSLMANLLELPWIDKKSFEVYEALCKAASIGDVEMAQLMLLKGVPPLFEGPFEACENRWQESRLTAVGYAIDNRQDDVVDLLLTYGAPIDEVHQKTKIYLRGHILEDLDGPETSSGALDLFFSKPTGDANSLCMLQFLLSKGAEVRSLRKETLFRIAVDSSFAELSSLLEAGLDPKSLYSEEEKSSLSYTPPVSLLDLAVMQAERANLFKEDRESICKVLLLLSKGANPLTKDESEQNFLHRVSHPLLIAIFGKARVDVRAKALLHQFEKEKFTPIEWAHAEEMVDLLCSFGEKRDNAPFIQGTSAHKKALKRIGVDPKFIKAFHQRDIAAFVALLGAGVDPNQKGKGGQTALHHLFSIPFFSSVNREVDFLFIASSFEMRLVNILIRHGARPQKDDKGRTPLMCLRSEFPAVIDLYAPWEAKYLKLDLDAHKDQIYSRFKRTPWGVSSI